MNRTIYSEELISLTAAKGDFKREFVEVFVTELTSIIEESLLSGENIKIDGFGEFKIIATQGGEKKNITFQTDESLKKGINAPFEQFETIIIGNDTVIPETEEKSISVDIPEIEENDINDLPEELLQTEESISEISDTVEKYKKSVSEEPAIAEEENSSVTIIPIKEESAESDLPATETPDPKEMTETNQIKDEEPLLTEEDKQESSTTDENNTGDRNNVSENIVIEDNTTLNDSDMNKERKTPDSENENAEFGFYSESDSIDNTQKDQEDQKDKEELLSEECEIVDSDGNLNQNSECNQYSKQVNKSGLYIVLILILIAILCCVIYFLVRVRNEEKEQIVPVEIINTTTTYRSVTDDDLKKINSESVTESQNPTDKKETAVIKNTPTANAPEAKTAAASAGKLYTIPANPVELKEGQRLTLLALRYYGNKCFWVYIYEANKANYPNPELIPIGAMLRIPQPSEYNINCENPQSVSKAKNMAAKILKEL